MEVRDSQNEEIERLRAKMREDKELERESKRKYMLNKARFLEEDSVIDVVSKDDLIKLANSLKSKSKVTCESLQAIMNSLLDSKENIKAFLSVDGALAALLRDLSGQNEKFQLLAARCICNLALGDQKESLQVLRASESYLLTHMSGKNRYVMEACTIAIGNFSRHGKKHIELLMSQGFLSKLTQLLHSSDEDLQDAVIYAFTHIVYQGFDILKFEDLQDIVPHCLAIFQKKSFAIAFLVSLLSARTDFFPAFMSFNIHTQALKCLFVSLKDDEKEVLYYLRIVSNCIAEESGKMAEDLTQTHENIFRECVKGLLNSEQNYLKKECLGIIGNLLNHPSQRFEVFGTLLLNENVRVIEEFVGENTGDASDDMMVT